jgi:hypothetical protein
MKNITDTEFVNIWESSSSRYDVAKKCGVTGAAVGMRAAKLRRAGVKLKLFPRGRRQKLIDVNILNTLIKNLNNNI